MAAPGHVLVVGAGLAGLNTCASLRALGFTGRVTLVGDEAHLPYDRPPLSKQFLAGERTAEEIALQPADWYDENKVEVRLGVPVVSLDAGSGPGPGVGTPSAELADGTRITADVLVLATGGRPRRLTVPGADHPAVRTLRTRADAESLRDALVPDARVMIVGAGLIGAEVASTATRRGCRVTLIDPTPLPMANAIGPHAARVLHNQHLAKDVSMICAGIDAVGARGDGSGTLGDGDSVHGVPVTLSSGDVLIADVIVAGIGMVPNTGLAEAAGLDVDNGVLVEASSMRTSAPSVYAVGDIARAVGSSHRSEHWDNARRTSEIAARAIVGLPAEPRRAPWFWTDRYGTHLEMTGLYDPEAEAVFRGNLAAGDGTVFYVRGDACVGAVSIDRPRDIRAAQRLIDRDVPVTAEQLADEDYDLRRFFSAGRP